MLIFSIGLVSSEHATDVSDVKNTIAQLYSTLNVEQHQIERERALLAQLEELKMQIQPLEEVHLQLWFEHELILAWHLL